SGGRVALIARIAAASRPMYSKSCGTKTEVMPTIMIVKPPAAIPTAVPSNKQRPTPKSDFQDGRSLEQNSERIPSLCPEIGYVFQRPARKHGSSAKVATP